MYFCQSAKQVMFTSLFLKRAPSSLCFRPNLDPLPSGLHFNLPNLGLPKFFL